LQKDLERGILEYVHVYSLSNTILPAFVFIKKEQLYGFPRCLALENPPDFCENPQGEYAENMRNLE
jgi:hypothetical protein